MANAVNSITKFYLFIYLLSLNFYAVVVSLILQKNSSFCAYIYHVTSFLFIVDNHMSYTVVGGNQRHAPCKTLQQALFLSLSSVMELMK